MTPSPPASRWPHPLWWATALCLAGLLAAPFLLVDAPPVVDYPNHLARFQILAHPKDADLSRFYVPHWAVLPNLGTDLLAAGLLQILPASIAGRLLLGLTLFAPMAGTVIYARALFGRFTYWSLGSALVAANFVFFMGFMNFLLGVGVALAGAGLWIMASRRGRLPALAVGTAASVIVFFCHLSALPLLGLLLAAHETARLWATRLSGDPGWRRDVAVSAAMLALTFLPAAILYGLSPGSAAVQATAYRPLGEKLLQLFTPFLAYSLPLAVISAAAVSCMLLGQRRRAGAGVGLVLAVLAVAYLAAPGWAKGGAFVDTRLPIMAGFMLFAGFAPTYSAPAGRVVAAMVGALLIVRTAQVAEVWRDHGQILAEFRSVIAEVPAGARVLTACRGGSAPSGAEPNCSGPGVYIQMRQHLPAMLVSERHAFWPLLFAEPTQQPLAVRPPFDRIASPLGEMVDARFLDAPLPRIARRDPYLKSWREEFEYLVVINVSAGAQASPSPAPGLGFLKGNRTAAVYRVVPSQAP